MFVRLSRTWAQRHSPAFGKRLQSTFKNDTEIFDRCLELLRSKETKKLREIFALKSFTAHILNNPDLVARTVVLAGCRFMHFTQGLELLRVIRSSNDFKKLRSEDDIRMKYLVAELTILYMSGQFDTIRSSIIPQVLRYLRLNFKLPENVIPLWLVKSVALSVGTKLRSTEAAQLLKELLIYNILNKQDLYHILIDVIKVMRPSFTMKLFDEIDRLGLISNDLIYQTLARFELMRLKRSYHDFHQRYSSFLLDHQLFALEILKSIQHLPLIEDHLLRLNGDIEVFGSQYIHTTNSIFAKMQMLLISIHQNSLISQAEQKQLRQQYLGDFLEAFSRKRYLDCMLKTQKIMTLDNLTLSTKKRVELQFLYYFRDTGQTKTMCKLFFEIFDRSGPSYISKKDIHCFLKGVRNGYPDVYSSLKTVYSKDHSSAPMLLLEDALKFRTWRMDSLIKSYRNGELPSKAKICQGYETAVRKYAFEEADHLLDILEENYALLPKEVEMLELSSALQAMKNESIAEPERVDSEVFESNVAALLSEIDENILFRSFLVIARVLETTPMKSISAANFEAAESVISAQIRFAKIPQLKRLSVSTPLEVCTEVYLKLIMINMVQGKYSEVLGFTKKLVECQELQVTPKLYHMLFYTIQLSFEEKVKELKEKYDFDLFHFSASPDYFMKAYELDRGLKTYKGEFSDSIRANLSTFHQFLSDYMYLLSMVADRKNSWLKTKQENIASLIHYAYVWAEKRPDLLFLH